METTEIWMTGHFQHYDAGPQADGILPDATRHVIELVNYVFLCNVLSLFGIVTNILNVVVFYRQGLRRNTVNISLTGLAVSDLCSLLALLWFNVCVNPLLARSGDVPFVPAEVQHLTGGWPHGCFARVTAWLTVLVTAERCLCIASPLKVKGIVTPRRMAAAVATVYLVIAASLLPEYATTYLDYKHYPSLNKSLIGLNFTPDRYKVEGLTFLLFAIYISVSFVLVIALTAILAAKLNRKSRWRSASTSDVTQSEKMSSRDKKTVKMVMVIAALMIVCFTPSVIVSVVGFAVPGFTVVGAYSNLFFVAWSFAFTLDAVNSSLSICLYYRMSSKYRKTFRQLFERRGKQNSAHLSSFGKPEQERH